MTQALPATIAPRLFAQCADAIINAARDLAARGWVPATSGNFSMRLDQHHIAITASGKDKGRLSREDIMVIDLHGNPFGTTARPSAETALHTQLYRHGPDINVVLHTHSRTQSVASRLFAPAGAVHLHGWELQKALAGQSTHDSQLTLPIFPNTQHMPELAARVAAWLDSGQPQYAYLIEGHGIYTWGRDMTETCRHLEALEFLLGCELDLRRLSP